MLASAITSASARTAVAVRSRPLSTVAFASPDPSALSSSMAPSKAKKKVVKKSAPATRPARKIAAKSTASEGSASATKGLVVGGKFPSLGKLETEKEGEFVDLDEVLKTTGIALFAYPKANTSGCTVQAIGFNDNFAAFEKAGYRVFGISADSPTTQSNWKTKHSFKYNLLCDRSFSALKKLGWAKSGGGVVRSHALIGKGGVVKDVVSPVSSKDSVNLALEALEAP